jgi:hypothetical protein
MPLAVYLGLYLFLKLSDLKKSGFLVLAHWALGYWAPGSSSVSTLALTPSVTLLRVTFLWSLRLLRFLVLLYLKVNCFAILDIKVSNKQDCMLSYTYIQLIAILDSKPLIVLLSWIVNCFSFLYLGCYHG